MEREEGVVVIGRAEIDTRAPFKSVKEAVMLFGERVLAGEVYANKLKEMRGESGHVQSRYGAVTAELEETKQSLQKAREEGNFMANCLQSLREELEQTKRELKQLKARESKKQLQSAVLNPETEDLKFIENSRNKVEFKTQSTTDGTNEGMEFQKKRCVTFASPPSLARVLMSQDGGEVLEKNPSVKKKTSKKPLVPLISWIFSKKKGTQEGESPRVQSP